MSFENKNLPQRCPSLDINENNLIKLNKRNDNLSKFLLVLLVIALELTYSIYYLVIYANVLQNGVPAFLASLMMSAVYLILLLVTIGSHDRRLDNSSHLFFFKKEKRLYKFVDNFSNASISVSDVVTAQQQEVDEHGNPVFYAEEVYEDDDDIFEIEAASTMLTKEKETTYQDLVDGFNAALESFGIHGNIATQLLSAMTFSKLIDVTKIARLVPTIFKALDNPNYVIHYDEETSITSQKVLINTFEYAKTHPNIPVFMMFDEIPSTEFLNYLRPLYRYIDDLNGDH